MEPAAFWQLFPGEQDEKRRAQVAPFNLWAFRHQPGYFEPMEKSAEPVTIASLRALGVRRLLAYCHGKRPDGWQCHHSDTLPIDRFDDGDACPISDAACDAPRADRGRSTCGRTTASIKIDRALAVRRAPSAG